MEVKTCGKKFGSACIVEVTQTGRDIHFMIYRQSRDSAES